MILDTRTRLRLDELGVQDLDSSILAFDCELLIRKTLSCAFGTLQKDDRN